MKLVLVTALVALYIVSLVEARSAMMLKEPSDFSRPPLVPTIKDIDSEIFMKKLEEELKEEIEAYLAMMDKLLNELSEQIDQILNEIPTETAPEVATVEIKEQPETNAVRKRKDLGVEHTAENSFLTTLMKMYQKRNR
ncbi:hypothetical protein RN001_010775 [Aquatica leii]|uniref:Uncharacterized protein n=1 Tax=Aquatica leii TaxID=1421715 RepID=A0AAN7PV85_9COLE|nr:hypothetical protein RN001_010775 [Aquatica leii]